MPSRRGRVGLPADPPARSSLPWANMRRPTGERQGHGITGAFVPEPPAVPSPPRRVVDVAPGDAEGARPKTRGIGDHAPCTDARCAAHAPTGAVRRAPAIARSGERAAPAVVERVGATEPVQLSQGALDRMTAELDELTRVKRREVVARIKSAREHGDLKENAEYHAAREEQSFLEGRVLALEDRLRRAVVVNEVATGKVIVGSTVTVEIGGDERPYTIVGSAEADPGGRPAQQASPVGAALLGRRRGRGRRHPDAARLGSLPGAQHRVGPGSPRPEAAGRISRRRHRRSAGRRRTPEPGRGRPRAPA